MHGDRQFAQVLVVAFAFASNTPTQAQCTKDTDCKGDRICVDGTCKEADATELTSVCSLARSIPQGISLGLATTEGRTILGEIGDAAMLENMPRIVTGNVPNAAAVVLGNERLIVYSDSFIESMRGTGGEWAVRFIFAHELGHHVEGHTVSGEGSNHKAEFQADAYATRVLKKMGASLQQTSSAMKSMPTPRSGTHPGSDERLDRIEQIYGGEEGLPKQSRKPRREPEQTQAEEPRQVKKAAGTQTRECGCHGFVMPGAVSPNPYCASGFEQAVPCQGFCVAGGQPWATVCR